jgi:hypothetical protein
MSYLGFILVHRIWSVARGVFCWLRPPFFYDILYFRACRCRVWLRSLGMLFFLLLLLSFLCLNSDVNVGLVFGELPLGFQRAVESVLFHALGVSI